MRSSLLLPLLLLTLPPLLTNSQSTSPSSSQPTPCMRWAHQTTLSQNTTLYIQGGQARLSPGQSSKTWTNALVSLDLGNGWDTGNPRLALVGADTTGGTVSGGDGNGGWAVALGALWGSKDGRNLFLYGGEFSDSPTVSPAPDGVLQYSISSKTWTRVTTTGSTVTRAAEGASAVVPSLGTNGEPMAFYFGGHEDANSVAGWSEQVARIYLPSMVSYDLGSGKWFNYTSYATNAISGTRNSTSEPVPIYRADGTLTYVPGMGTNNKGVLVSIGGGNDQKMMDNSVLDVFDIGAGGWTRQATQGATLSPRTNHCAVRASAKVNGVLQHQIFVYGGQIANQSTRYSDVYILTIPSYTWTFVGNSLSGQPAPRAGHTCDIVGSQMIVVGGLVSNDLLCDQPGIYIYDVSKSSWQTQYTPNTFYTTPQLVANVTGGIGSGGSSSSSGSAIGGDGSLWPDTSGSNGNGTGTGGAANSSGGGGSGTNVGPIVGGVLGGVIALALLCGFVYWYAHRQGRIHAYQEEGEEEGATGPSSVRALPLWLRKHRRDLSLDSELPSRNTSTNSRNSLIGFYYRNFKASPAESSSVGGGGGGEKPSSSENGNGNEKITGGGGSSSDHHHQSPRSPPYSPGDVTGGLLPNSSPSQRIPLSDNQAGTSNGRTLEDREEEEDDDMRNMDVQGLGRLVPKRSLRIVNPDM